MKKPQFIQIIPPIAGKNISVPPQTINDLASPDLLNVRFSYGQLQSRSGFKGKYFGCGSHPVSIDVVFNADGLSQVIAAFCLDGVYKQISSTTIMTPIQAAIEITAGADTNSNTVIDNISGWTSGYTIDDVIIGSLIWDAAGDIPAGTVVTAVDSGSGEITISQAATGSSSTTINVASTKALSTGNSDNFSIDVGEGTYDSRIMNGGVAFPLSGYGAVLAFTNAVDGVFVVFVGDSSPHSGIVICEQIYDLSTVGLLGANCVTFFDNRLIVGGTSNSSSELLWSASSVFNDFSSAGSGSILLGEGIDWIQTMRKMGEFLIVYKERSIYIGQRSGKVDPAITFAPAPGQGIGLSAPETIGDLGEEHIFLGWDNIYTISVNGITAIGDSIRDELFGVYGDNGIVPAYLKRCIGTIVEEFSEYWLMIPTGKIPEVTNLLSRPMMDFIKIVNMDITNGSTTVTNIDQGEINYIKIGDTIKHSQITGGSALVMGLPHISSTISANSLEMNKQATDTISDTTGTVGNDDVWAIAADGDGTFATVVGSGSLGGIYQKIYFSSGTFVTLFSTLIDIGTTGNREISLLIWIKGSVSFTVTVSESNAASVSLGVDHVLSSSIDSTSFIPIAFSFTCTDATCRKLRILVKNTTSGEDLCIDGVQLCDITSIPSEFRYILGGYEIPGYKSHQGIVSPIPFFISSIGPWILDTLWIYNYQTNSWACWRMPLTGFGYDSALTSYTIADLTGTVEEQLWRFDDKLLEALSPTNLIGGMDGQIYEISSAYQRDYEGFNNSAILAYWQSKDFDLGNPELDKTFSRLVIRHEISHPATAVTVSISTNSGITWQDQVITIRQGYTETYADFFVTGSQGRFKVQTEGVLKITGFILKVIQRGETNAY